MRAVSNSMAAGWARKHGMTFLETSAKNNVRINDAFVTLVAQAVGRGSDVETLLTTARVTQAGHGGAGKPSELSVLTHGHGTGKAPPSTGGCC